MKSCNFSYHDPQNVADVVSLMSRHENAKLLAGGQSLVPMLNFRILSPEHIIDLNKVSDLFGISLTTNGASGLLNDLTESNLTVNSFNLRST